MSAARPNFRPSHEFLPGHRPRAVSALTVALGTIGSAVALVLGPVGLGVASAQVAPAGPSASPSASASGSSSSASAAPSATPSATSSPTLSAASAGSAAAPAAVGPGITAASTFSKSGTDTSTGSTADSSTGTVGTTGPGHTINWVLSYHNSTGSSASVNMTDPLSGQTFVPGSLKAPPGFTPQWSTDGGSNFVNTEEPSGVNAVGATGTLASAAGAVADVPEGTGGFAGSVATGDGYEALFFGNNVYNVHHHAGAAATDTLLDCHVKTTGASCPGYGTSGVYVSPTSGAPFTTSQSAQENLKTPQTSSSVVDRTTGRLYTPVAIFNTNQFGLLCMDLATETSCGIVEQFTSPWVQNSQSARTGNTAMTGATGVGTRVYWTDFDANVHCYDYSSNSDCGTVQAIPGYANPGGSAETNAWGSRTEAFGQFVFLNWAQEESADATGAPRFLSCIDTTTNTVCPGFPRATPSHQITTPVPIPNTDMTPVLTTSGSLSGICISDVVALGGQPFACYDMAGSPIANPYPATFAAGEIGYAGFGDGVVIGAKVYLPFFDTPTTTTQYVCFNFATGAPCAGFNNAASSSPAVYPYTLRQDPYAPACLWEVGDAGVIQVISKNTGGSCADSEADVVVTPSAYYCDGGSHTSAWTNVSIEGVTSTDYTNAQVTVLDNTGSIVPGFNAITVPSTQQTVDISSIPMSGATSTLSVSVTLVGLRAGITPAPRVDVGFSGDPVQVCFQTTVPDACPAAGATLSNTANVVTAGFDGTSDAPAGNTSNAATFDITTSGPCGLSGSKVLASVNGVPFVDQLIQAGDVLLFQITINNSGIAADSTTLTETVGAGLSYTGTGEGWSGSCTTAGTTCTQVVTVPGGASQTVDFTETADTPLPNSGIEPISNTVTSSNGTIDPGTVTVPTVPVALIGSWAFAGGLLLILGIARTLHRRRRSLPAAS